MVMIDAIRPLTDRQTAAMKMLMTPPCPHCAAGLKPVRLRGGRQYVHYDRDERRVIVCTEVRP